jgi:hypothetical protein
MIGTMSMFYVTNPDKAVALIQSFINDESPFPENTSPKKEIVKEAHLTTSNNSKLGSKRHTLDTREKIRDVLR